MFFFGNISQTWELMGQSWGVLKQDKEMLVFPLVSGLCCLLVTASFLIPTIINDTWMPPGSEMQVEITEEGAIYSLVEDACAGRKGDVLHLTMKKVTP